VTPNQLTTVRLALGVAAAASLAVGGAVAGPVAALPGETFWPHLGAGLFVLSMLFDRADGDLARMTGRTSPGGHLYDLIADGMSDALLFIGLGLGLRDGAFGTGAIGFGFLAGLSIALIFYLVMRIEAIEGERGGELPSFGGFDVDDAIILVPFGIWFGVGETLLAAAAAVTPLAALFFFVMFLRNARKHGA